MYGRQADNNLSAGVIIETATDQSGQQFKQNLEDRLNPNGVMPPHPAYKLAVTLTTIASPIGVSRDGTVSRYNVSLDSAYTLTRLKDGVVVNKGNVRHVGSYNNQPNLYFSTYIAERDAVKRGIVELSELYRQRIATFLTRHEN